MNLQTSPIEIKMGSQQGYFRIVWIIGHQLTYLANESNIGKIKLFFEKYDKLIDCTKCIRKYKEYTKDNLLENIRTSEQLQRWLIDLHNKTNGDVKTKKICTYDEVRLLYKSFDFRDFLKMVINIDLEYLLRMNKLDKIIDDKIKIKRSLGMKY
jgi:hypothetical protein